MLLQQSILRSLSAVSFALLPFVTNAASQTIQTAHLRSTLVAATTSAQVNSTLTLGLLFEHESHWHTYWQNPGDSGLKTIIEFTLPDGVQAQGIDWPAPQRFELGELVNYGYTDRTLLPIRVVISKPFNASSLTIKAKAKWLICETECIPGKAEYEFTLPVKKDASEKDDRWQKDFERSAARQPKMLNVDAQLQIHNDSNLQLTLQDKGIPEDLSSFTLFPFAEDLIAYSSTVNWQHDKQQWQTPLKRSTYFTAMPPSSQWLLVKADQVWQVSARGIVNN